MILGLPLLSSAMAWVNWAAFTLSEGPKINKWILMKKEEGNGKWSDEE